MGGGGKTPNVPTEEKKTLMRERTKRASASESYIFRSPNNLHVQSMQFPFISYGMALYRQYNDKQNTDIEYASERSERA